MAKNGESLISDALPALASFAVKVAEIRQQFTPEEDTHNSLREMGTAVGKALNPTGQDIGLSTAVISEFERTMAKTDMPEQPKTLIGTFYLGVLSAQTQNK